MIMMTIFFFFFSSRRRHTRYWRDWSSDVCSSDLYNSFRSMEELKEVLIQKAKALFLEYIQNNRTELPFLNMGLGFCIFAKEESNLFRNIFLNPNTEGNIIEQFREVSQQEIVKDGRFDSISERSEE